MSTRAAKSLTSKHRGNTSGRSASSALSARPKTKQFSVLPDQQRLTELSTRLGVTIPVKLLGLALTHRSYSFENGEIPHNERLEFLGDAVLGQAITVRLYHQFPDVSEGELAKRRSGVVSTRALSDVARELGLGEFILLGHGEQLSGGRDKSSILADTVEAIIGACYVGLGAEAATDLVLRLIAPLIDDPSRSGVALDPKTALQELADHSGEPAPVYAVEGTGPDHARVFRATVTVGTHGPYEGEATSKKQAEMAAAYLAWQKLSASGASSSAPATIPASTPESAAALPAEAAVSSDHVSKHPESSVTTAAEVAGALESPILVEPSADSSPAK